MPVQRLHLRVQRADITRAIDDLLDASEIHTEFDTAALNEAYAAARSWLEKTGERLDATDVPFVTLDPAESTDLDQAMYLEETPTGYRVRYAIADVPLFVELGSSLDASTRQRGLTLYLPDRRIPLHPPVISEGAGSLLPGQRSPAFVWDLELDADARLTHVALRRCIVMSREKLAYDSVQDQIDAGEPHPQMELLQEIGNRRAALEVERGGASLGTPEQDIVADGEHMRLEWRRPAPIEDANAQISLLAGMAAARIMIDGGAGILRTMPPASNEAIAKFRDQARALKEPWPEEMSYGQFLRTLDPRKGRHLALLTQATALFRGAGYVAFSGGEVPEHTVQAALAAPYAHTTAPLRRLVDRFTLIVCEAHLNGRTLDERLIEAMHSVPELMAQAQGRNSPLERKAREIVEAAVLSNNVGEVLEGTVVDVRERSADESHPYRAHVQCRQPPTAQWVPTPQPLEIGTRIAFEIVSVDSQSTAVRTRLVEHPHARR